MGTSILVSGLKSEYYSLSRLSLTGIDNSLSSGVPEIRLSYHCPLGTSIDLCFGSENDDNLGLECIAETGRFSVFIFVQLPPYMPLSPSTLEFSESPIIAGWRKLKLLWPPKLIIR